MFHVQRDALDFGARCPIPGLQGAQFLEALAQRQRLAEVEIGAAQPLTLLPCEPDQEAKVFGPFHRAVGLGGHGFDLVQLVVHDGGRHQIHFGTVDFVDGVGDVAQDAEHRRPQLAGSGAAAFDRPGQVDVVLHQLRGVRAQYEPVDRNVFGLTPDEDGTGALGEAAHREEVHVRAPPKVSAGVSRLAAITSGSSMPSR